MTRREARQRLNLYALRQDVKQLQLCLELMELCRENRTPEAWELMNLSSASMETLALEIVELLKR